MWDATTGRPIDRLEVPVGDFYAANAGLALSPDGRYLAYSAGAQPGSKGVALIRDTAAHTTVAWDTPAGFDRLAWESGSRFRLVRDEFVGNTQVLETVVRRLELDRPPEEARVLRQSRTTDTRRHLEAWLTRDGLHYIWWGPRLPGHLQRVEVYDVTTGATVVQVEPPEPPIGRVPDVRLAPWDKRVRIDNGDVQVWRLPTSPGDSASPLPPDDWLPRGQWYTSGETEAAFPALFPPERHTPWLRLWHCDPASSDGGGHFSFSRETRRLAWASGTGTILTTHIDELVRAVEEFESAHR